MSLFTRWRSLPREKSKEELDEHYKRMDVEKGDMFAMILGGFLAFAPILLGVAVLFALVLFVLR